MIPLVILLVIWLVICVTDIPGNAQRYLGYTSAPIALLDSFLNTTHYQDFIITIWLATWLMIWLVIWLVVDLLVLSVHAILSVG